MIIKELSQLINSDVKTLLGQVKITMLGQKVVCIQNFVKLTNYGKEQIVFKVKNNELTVEGTDLNIVQLGKSEVVINGIINKLYYKKDIQNVKN